MDSLRGHRQPLIKLVQVPPQSVGLVWQRIGPDFEIAAKHTRRAITSHSIRDRATMGSCTIWIVADDADTEVTAACATSQVAFPGGLRAFFVELIAGKRKEDVFNFRATLERHAKASGCDAVFWLIPKKWSRGNPMPDYRISNIIMCKELP